MTISRKTSCLEERDLRKEEQKKYQEKEKEGDCERERGWAAFVRARPPSPWPSACRNTLPPPAGRPFPRAPLPQDEHPAPSCSSLLPKEGTSLPSTNILPALCLHWSLGPASLLGLPALGHLSHSWPSFTSVDKALVSILENFCRTLLSPLRTSRILSSSMITFLLSDAPTRGILIPHHILQLPFTARLATSRFLETSWLSNPFINLFLGPLWGTGSSSRLSSRSTMHFCSSQNWFFSDPPPLSSYSMSSNIPMGSCWSLILST